MWRQPETERKNQGWKSCSHVKMGISRGENGAPSRISTRRHTHRHRDRGVARHPSRIGEISVSARNPPLLFPRVPLAGFCSSCSSSSSCAALPPLFTPRNPRRACHARCIVVLSGAISLSVSGTQESLVRVNLSTHVTHIPHNTAEACTRIATRA